MLFVSRDEKTFILQGFAALFWGGGWEEHFYKELCRMQDVVMNGEWVKDFLGNYLGPNDAHYAFRFTTLSQLWGVR